MGWQLLATWVIITSMKFQKLEALEKHFKEAYPDHLSPIYIVISSHESERKKILQSLAGLLAKDSDFKRCGLLKDALTHLQGASLFSPAVTALFDGLESLVKTEGELLASYVKSPPPKTYLLLGSSTLKPANDLYKVGKNEIVILDLTKEKPWEEKARLQKWVVQVIRQHQKTLSPDAIEAFFSRLPADRLLMQQEIDKLLAFSHGRQEITKQDVEAICSTTEEQNLFHLARALAFSHVAKIPILSDLSTLLPLIGALRMQLEMGLKLSALLRKQTPPDDIASAFPRLWPKALQEAITGTKQKGETFFKNALLALYDLELGLKMSKAKPETLFTRFCATIHG
jgi:DNA polymerase III delta subunit